MENWSNEQESGNASDTDSYRYPKKTRNHSHVENNSLEAMAEDNPVENKEIDKQELADPEDNHNENEPEVFESMSDRYVTCEITEEATDRRLKLDAVMITPPNLKKSSSMDETSTSGLELPEINVIVNTKALPREAKTYELEKFQKSCLHIFNQESIDGYEPRLGTDQDVRVLTETFESLGFEVKEHRNFTKEKIFEFLDTFKTKNFTEYGCVGVVVLTHGSFNGLLRAKDNAYSETDIINYFRVYDKPTLITKPKLLIIQACRGTMCLPGVTVQAMGKIRKDVDMDVEPYILPVMSDMLVVHSSYVGEVSTRDEIHGSWFIQTLCNKIRDMSPVHDLESILIEVKREVAVHRHWEDYNRATREMDIYKQMPTVTSTLIRKLHFRKFGDVSPLTTYVDAAGPSTSREPVLDTATTPLLVQFGPCSCFLDHFDYIKKCLSFFLEENPHDATAKTYLNISNAFENDDQFNAAKERMGKAICDHLSLNARHCDFFKYLYFYKS